MKELIHLTNIAQRKLYCALAALLFLSLAHSASIADTFVPAHDTIRITSASTVNVLITDLTTHSIHLKASLSTSDVSLWHLLTGDITIGADTTHTGYFEVAFLGTGSGTFTSTLRLSDSVGNTTKYVTIIATIAGLPASQLHAILLGTFSGTHLDSTVCRPVIFYAALDTGSISLNSISLTTTSSAWTLDDSKYTLPLTMTHGILDTIHVCFSPGDAREYHDSVAFSYTDVHGHSQVTYVALTGNGVHDTTIVTTPTCFHVSGDTSAFGPITSGSHQSRTFEISNTSTATWILSHVNFGGDSSVWSVSGITFPDTLAPNTGTHFTVTFLAPTVTAQQRYEAYFNFFGAHGGDNCDHGVTLRGYAKHETTTTIVLAPDTTQAISFDASKPGTTYKYISVKNNSGHRLKVEGISLSGGTNFTVTLVSPDSTIPFYLSGDGTLLIKLTLTDTMSGTYHDTLLITTEAGITALTVPIDAVVSTTAGVAPIAATEHVAIGVNPNPSSNGAVTLSLGDLRHADVEVLDLLGRTVWQAHDVTGSYKWSGSTLTGGTANTGAYIVRVTGQLSSGKIATASARFLIEH